MSAITLRPATSSDVEKIVSVWQMGWRETHLGYVPDALISHRDERSFGARARQCLDDFIVATMQGAVAGFVMTRSNEVEQLYVDARMRGIGMGGRLLRSAESRIGTQHQSAWLAVVADNTNARKFYEDYGWYDAGPYTHRAWTAYGAPVDVPVRRYEKKLCPQAISKEARQ